LRVVHLGKYYPPALGGIETHTRTLARGQAALGAAVRVVAVNHADAAGRDVTFAPRSRTPDVTEGDGPVVVDRVGRWFNLAKLDVTPRLGRAIRAAAADKPDVWHLHTPNVTMLLAVLASRRVRPLVVTHHSDVVLRRILKPAYRALEQEAYRRAVRLLADSPAYPAGSPVLRRFRAKVEPLPLGLDLVPFRTPSPAAVGFADSLKKRHPGPLWLSVGRHIYYKGLEVAVKALPRVPGTLIVIGDGPARRGWKRLAEATGVADRVAWLGRASADELVGAYHAATAFWFPSTSRAEGFGLVQVEAMASGCPVINTAIPDSGVPWVARDGVAGLTVPVGDPGAFAAAARRLVEEPGLRDRLAAGGVREAEERFDHRLMAARSLAIYERVLAGGRR
jgi:rhamnosyl/mannosyltransferase